MMNDIEAIMYKGHGTSFFYGCKVAHWCCVEDSDNSINQGQWILFLSTGLCIKVGPALFNEAETLPILFCI